MSRKAFIIVGFAPYKVSWLDNPTNVHIDIDSKYMKKYLESDLGGSWIHKVDLEILIDQPKSEITKSLSAASEDYTLIYFTGHGGLIGQKEFIGLKNEDRLEMLELKTNSLKQVIIIEACRCAMNQIYKKLLPVISNSPNLKNQVRKMCLMNMSKIVASAKR